MLTLSTYDGHAINDGTHYAAIIPEDAPLLAQASANAVKRSRNYPVFSGKTLDGIKLPVVIAIRSGSLDEIKTWFDNSKNELAALVAVDGSAEQWYLMATPVAMDADGPLSVTVVLFVPDPVWRSVTEYNASWTVTADGQTKVISNAGMLETYPKFEITPGAGGSGGYRFRRFVGIINRATGKQLDNYPIEVTGGLDTATLVTAGKMQADGDDVRLMLDGVEIPRWLTGMNTSSTKVWTVMSLAPPQSMTLGVAIPASGNVGEIYIKASKANDAALRKLPASGIVKINDEYFAYNGMDLKLRKLGGVQRAAKGSSMALHAVNAVITWIEHDVWLIYGNSTVEAPEQDESHKPVIDLEDSSNTNWVYEGLFADAAMLRAGGWKGMVNSSTGKQSVIYTATEGTEAEPVSAMGCEANIWYKTGRVQGESALISWTLYNPCGFASIASTGKKRRAGTSFPGAAALQRSGNGSSWTTVWNENSPVNVNTWTAWNRTTSNMSNQPFARFVLSGSLKAVIDEQAQFETLTVTAALTSTTTPTVTLSGENGQTWQDFTITNQTTGESMQLMVSAQAGGLIRVDSDQKTVDVDGQNQIGALTLSSARRDWLRMISGNNTLRLNTVNTPDLAIVVKWRKRML